jgi:SAM-dependent methyltransferase
MGYTVFDRFVAFLRFRAASRHIKPHWRVCDIGCGLDARFLHFIEGKVAFGVGLDYQVRGSGRDGPFIVCCDIAKGLPLGNEKFDCAVMLAVLEHLELPQPLFKDVFRILNPGGMLILTWPQAVIDPILDILHRIGFISAEMESDKHQPRIPAPQLISTLQNIGFTNFERTKFEFGINNLLVCQKV